VLASGLYRLHRSTHATATPTRRRAKLSAISRYACRCLPSRQGIEALHPAHIAVLLASISGEKRIAVPWLWIAVLLTTYDGRQNTRPLSQLLAVESQARNDARRAWHVITATVFREKHWRALLSSAFYFGPDGFVLEACGALRSAMACSRALTPLPESPPIDQPFSFTRERRSFMFSVFGAQLGRMPWGKDGNRLLAGTRARNTLAPAAGRGGLLNVDQPRPAALGQRSFARGPYWVLGVTVRAIISPTCPNGS